MTRRERRVFLDKDYQKIFKPFYYVQWIYCMQAFNVKKNYATQITKYNYALAAFINILVLVVFYETIKHKTFWDNNATIISNITYCQYVQSFMLVTFLNFYQNKTHFQLLARLQELCQAIRNTEDTKRLKIVSWTYCGAVLMYYVCLVLFKLIRDQYWHWARAIFLMTTIVFEAKLANVTVILYFLVLKLRKWRNVLQNHIIEGTNKEILNVFIWNFQKVISVFSLFKKTFQAIVLFHFVLTFFQSLVYIEIIIISFKTAPNDETKIANHVVGVVSWITKGVVIELLFCTICELFYSELEKNCDEIQQLGSKLYGLEERQRKELNRFNKCVKRIMDNDFSRMTACGMFTVDVSLPLRLAGVVASYSLVLLQFAQ